MPLLLDSEDYETWLHGDIKDVIRLMFRPPSAAQQMEVIRTEDLWRGGVGPQGTKPKLTLV